MPRPEHAHERFFVGCMMLILTLAALFTSYWIAFPPQ